MRAGFHQLPLAPPPPKLPPPLLNPPPLLPDPLPASEAAAAHEGAAPAGAVAGPSVATGAAIEEERRDHRDADAAQDHEQEKELREAH